MRGAYERALILAVTLLLSAGPGLAQEAQPLDTGQASNVTVGADGSPSSGTQPVSADTTASAFSPVDGLAGGGASTGTGTGNDATAGGSAPPAGVAPGGQGGIQWTTLVTYKPQPTKSNLPPWWTLVKDAPSAPEAPKKDHNGGGGGGGGGNGSGDSNGGDLGQSIVAAADKIANKPFHYAPGTENGNLGCADVATTILRNGGVKINHEIGVLAAVSDLRNVGWHDVNPKPPPYHDGDVITWATYDRTGDGKVDPDAHIGIISVEGGTVYTIANSSSRREPQKVELSYYHYPITRVMRAG